MIRLLLLFILSSITLYGQDNRPTQTIEPFFNIQFDDAERDSLLGNLMRMKGQIAALHSYNLTNSVMPAIIFDPFPANFSQKNRPELIEYSIPAIDVPKDKDQLAFYTLGELSYLIKNRIISSQELTQFFINRLKIYSDTLQSTILILEKEALEQAANADRELAQGNYRGPLHGIPYGVKDLLAIKGTRTTWGAMPYKEQQINETATVVKNLEKAGAVLVAKLTLGALAMGDVWYGGVTKNPWKLEQGSSGSSAGSAAAVAAGLLPYAIGTETLGSIVSPSTRCGTTGLRPTYGRVSRYGAMALSWTMDKIGPITRDAQDAAIVFEALQGKDLQDPTTVDMKYNYQPVEDLTNIKVGYFKDLFEQDYSNKEFDQATLQKLKDLGANLQPVSLPDSFPMSSLYMILMAEGAAAFDQLTREDLDNLLVRQDKSAWPNLFRAARFIPAVDYINANRVRRILQNSLHKLFSEYDVIISPTYGGAQLLMTNLTGHPAVVVPNGFREDGTPVSITFLGNLFDEGIVLAVARLYQENSTFDDQHPDFFK